jgi:hypothetical protein
MNIKDVIQDVVGTTSSLKLSMVRVSGSETHLDITAKNDDNTVLIVAKTKSPIDDLNEQVIGLRSLDILKGITNLKGFKDDSFKVDVRKVTDSEGNQICERFVFNNESNEIHYGLASKAAIPNKVVFAGTSYNVEVKPTKLKIDEFSTLAGILGGLETTFTPHVTDKKELVFDVGNTKAASHSAKLVFAKDVVGTIASDLKWNIAPVLAVLKLAENTDSDMKISSDGVIEIAIDTGVIEYQFFLPALN